MITLMILNDQNGALTKLVSKEEIEAIIKDMHLEKAS